MLLIDCDVCMYVVAVSATVGGDAGRQQRHVPLYGRLVAEEQLLKLTAPSDIQVMWSLLQSGTNERKTPLLN